VRALALLTLGLVLVTACTTADPERPHDEVETCEPGFTTPEGFQQTESLEDRYADHVGIRLGFRDQDGRELHYFAGVPGEFGEGLPTRGSVPAATGVDAVLQGSGEVWVLSWQAPGPCGRRAVLGNGFTRQGFLQTLRQAAVIPV
jgi:hypothetical protein